MFALIPSTPIPLGFLSRLLLPIVSFVVREKMSSSGVVRYVPGSFAGKGVKVESLDQLERIEEGLVRTGVFGRFPSQNYVRNAAPKEFSVSDESIESTITSYDDVYFSDLEEVAVMRSNLWKSMDFRRRNMVKQGNIFTKVLFLYLHQDHIRLMSCGRNWWARNTLSRLLSQLYLICRVGDCRTTVFTQNHSLVLGGFP